MSFYNKAKAAITKKFRSNDHDDKYEEYLQKLAECRLSDLNIDFACLTDFEFEIGSLAYSLNYERNRYGYEIVDETRVHLSSDIYINANHVTTGPNGINFIAAEAPTSDTVNKFWQMCVEHNCNHIVMLCKFEEENKQKCYQYFPVEGEKKLGSFEIHVSDINEIIFRHNGTDSKIIERKLLVTNLVTNKKKEIVHYNFISWTDHSVPENMKPLIYLYQMIMAEAMNNNSSVLVHCSAGIGRTGVFIGGQFCYELFINNELESIKDALIKLRKMRFGSVQRKQQYVFLHCLLIELLLVRGNSKIEKSKLLKLKQKYGQMLEESRQPPPPPKSLLLKRLLSAP